MPRAGLFLRTAVFGLALLNLGGCGRQAPRSEKPIAGASVGPPLGVELGIPYVSKETAFGVLAAAWERTPPRMLYVLDGSQAKVYALDSDLRVVKAGGRRGAGPGEMMQPIALGLQGNDIVVLLDRALRRITWFKDYKKDSTLKVVGTAQLKVPAEGMCILSDSLIVVLGLSEGRRLHVIDRAGSTVRSFGDVDTTLSPMAEELVTTGVLACSGEGERVAIAYRFLPWVEEWDVKSGKRRWRASLQPHRSTTVVDRGNKVSLRSGPAGYSRIVGAEYLRGTLIVQSNFEGRLDGVFVDSIATFVCDSGRQRGLPSYDLPLIVQLRGQVALTAEEADSGHLLALRRVGLQHPSKVNEVVQ